MQDQIIELRRTLHQFPELSESEVETARRISEFFRPLQPDSVLQHLGGNGVAFSFHGFEEGPTILLRCELDALPIQEENQFTYRSCVDGSSHQCGHDGHMAILASVGCALATRRPKRGRVVLLFQPAEETGQGASAVIQDRRFAEIQPDWAFALHNLPRYPLGEIVVRTGTMCCASCGMLINLFGKTSHAAQPETGKSSANAMCQIIDALQQLPSGNQGQNEIAFATVVGAKLGDAQTFGTLPADAWIMSTLRSESNAEMNVMVMQAETLVTSIANSHGLESAISYQDIFVPTVNAEAAVEIIRRSVGKDSITILTEPFRWSEDFGHFTALASGALFGIGAGESHPDLHQANYDFPDALIAPATLIFQNIIHEILG